MERPTSSAPAFRFARREDVPLILSFIRRLAEYERLAHQVVADEATLEEQLFDRRGAEVLFALEGEKEVGFALFFHNFGLYCQRILIQGYQFTVRQQSKRLVIYCGHIASDHQR